MSLVNDMLKDLEARSERRAQAVLPASRVEHSRVENVARLRMMPVAIIVAATVVLALAVQKFVWPMLETNLPATVAVIDLDAETKSKAQAEPQVAEESTLVANPIELDNADISQEQQNESAAGSESTESVIASSNNEQDEVLTVEKGTTGSDETVSVSENSIAQQLALAEQCFAVDRLTTPADDNALAHYEAVLVMEPDQEQALEGIERIVQRYVELAEIAEVEHNPVRVERYHRRAKALAEQYPSAGEWLARYLSKDQSSISRAPSLQFQDQQLAQEAQQLVDNGDIRTAINRLEQFVAANSGAEASENLLVDLYVRNERYQAALKQVDNSPSLAAEERRLRRSRIFIAQEQFQSALDELAGGRPAMQTHQDYYALQAALLHQLGRYQDAAALYQRLLAVERDQFTYWLGLAVSLDALQDWSAALQAFQHARQLGSADSDSLRYVNQRIQSLSEPG